ncbi:MAG: NnrS family protein [Alphaproteobacteria bacterium]|nr:NnrS family protein [Alphaproteobacteria bacterium]
MTRQAAIPRYRVHHGPDIFSAGFRPFFLLAALWAAVAVPVWLVAYLTGLVPPSAFPAIIWHAHEMVYGYGAAAVAGFLLTAIPNWTGRMPLQGWSLAMLVVLWVIGRLAVLLSALVGTPLATVADLMFPAVFLLVVAREIVAGRNWRNLPMLIALSLLLIGNLLVHLESLGVAETAQIGNRLGIGVLLALISLVGGRIIPSFTRNWLTKNVPDVASPSSASRADLVALIITVMGIAAWVLAPETRATAYLELMAGLAAAWRLSRWRGPRTLAEPLVTVLHVGYGWLAAGLLLLGFNGLVPLFPATTALHALTVGAIGTMTLAVMTRATLGHTGRPLSATGTTAILYGLVSVAAVLRLAAPFTGSEMALLLSLAGTAWCLAFLLYLAVYGPMLVRARATRD